MLKSKTFWSGLAGILGAGAGYYTGALSPVEASGMAFTALQTIFLRAAIAKGQEAA